MGRRDPKNCAICETPTKPNKYGHYPKCCSPQHSNKLRSRNSSKSVKEGRIPQLKGLRLT